VVAQKTSASLCLLQELVALPSVNPAFLPEDHPWAGEHRVADFLMATAARASLDVSLEPVTPKRANFIARLTPAGRVRRRVLLAPHMDTVGIPDEALLKPVVKNGRLTGRGACDTKGCVAAMLTALMDVAASGERPQETEIVFVGLIDEENGQGGSWAFIKNDWKADLAIVGEPTQLQVVTAHKGDVWLQLETQGKSAHGAKPELGKNAVHLMARIVDLFETKYAASLKRHKHPLLGHGTINVGTIAGGTQPNIVPAQCRISIDRRTIPGETEASVRREIQALLREHKLAAKLLNIRNAPCVPLETDHRLPLVQQLFGVVKQKEPVGVDYFCDAAVLASGGIPSVVFGPGSIAQAHTVDEWISVRSLEDGTRLLTQFLRSLA
jgi:acetylornithine deacetylase/succinyl-diaminopimelate desuccinylase-like protein